ncbi:MAG: hypothetical protein LBS54_01260 [Dysgonamonadaceae bacterium]|jgi:hypothetical protein|nr:hypothetical protein [Dysgonamonadaceae bacterium]
MKKYFLIAVALLMMSAGVVKAQVTIGATNDPHDFSILELVSNGNLGLRLPQMTTEQRDAMVQTEDFQAEKNGKARGLQIFNMTTKCVETWNGSKWIQSCFPEVSLPKEEILFTIKTITDGETYYIPTSGRVGGTYHSYNWNVVVDNGTPKHAEYTGSHNQNGIALTFSEAGTHQIHITPFDSPAPGWGNAFGHDLFGDGNANSTVNRDKLISIDAPLTTMAFAPNENSTSANQMFAYMFNGCKNLTTGAKIVDTYKLPETVKDLSEFLRDTHHTNPNLETPINLSGLQGWFSNNQTIINLRQFIAHTHYDNTKLTSPIDLTPLSGWFNGNTSIMYMTTFFGSTHYNNIKLTSAIDLTQIKDWFDANNNITTQNLSAFLSETHYCNYALNLEGQSIFPNWIKILNNGKIQDVENAFFKMFYLGGDKNEGDTGEPTFEGGGALSSLGQPNSYRYTYYSRISLPKYGSLGLWK